MAIDPFKFLHGPDPNPADDEPDTGGGPSEAAAANLPNEAQNPAPGFPIDSMPPAAQIPGAGGASPGPGPGPGPGSGGGYP